MYGKNRVASKFYRDVDTVRNEIISVIVLCLLCSASFSSNASIIYKINHEIPLHGLSGNVEGVIEIDGSQGFIDEVNIMSWNLELTLGEKSVVLNKNNSIFNSQGDFLGRIFGLYANSNILAYRVGLGWMAERFWVQSLNTSPGSAPYGYWCMGNCFVFDDEWDGEVLDLVVNGESETGFHIDYGSKQNIILGTIPLPESFYIYLLGLVAIIWQGYIRKSGKVQILT